MNANDLIVFRAFSNDEATPSMLHLEMNMFAFYSIRYNWFGRNALELTKENEVLTP